MKSPIPWIGGKSQLKSKIIKSFPPTESYNRFIDVFGGGGSILFAKGKHADLEIYNDANSDLVVLSISLDTFYSNKNYATRKI